MKLSILIIIISVLLPSLPCFALKVTHEHTYKDVQTKKGTKSIPHTTKTYHDGTLVRTDHHGDGTAVIHRPDGSKKSVKYNPNSISYSDPTLVDSPMRADENRDPTH